MLLVLVVVVAVAVLRWGNRYMYKKRGVFINDAKDNTAGLLPIKVILVSDWCHN